LHGAADLTDYEHRTLAAIRALINWRKEQFLRW
jgi:hypothetical protein